MPEIVTPKRRGARVVAGGVCLGFIERVDGKDVLSVKDRDQRRCNDRGDDCVKIDLEALRELLKVDSNDDGLSHDNK